MNQPTLQSVSGAKVSDFGARFSTWEHTSTDEVCGLRITPFPTAKLQSLRKKFAEDRFHAFGLEIRMQDYHFVASGDLGVPKDPHLLIAFAEEMLPQTEVLVRRSGRLPLGKR